MEKFKPVTKPCSLDFYSIFEEDGVKYIHVHGYTYGSDGYWANMECCWFIERLDDFIAHTKENEDYADEVYSDLKQYQGDHTAEEIVDIINHYFDGNCADAFLDFSEITMDTPCGNYVC